MPRKMEKWVPIGGTVVYYARAAYVFSAGIKCRHSGIVDLVQERLLNIWNQNKHFDMTRKYLRSIQYGTPYDQIFNISNVRCNLTDYASTCMQNAPTWRIRTNMANTVRGLEIFCQTQKKMQVLRRFIVGVNQSTTGIYQCCSRSQI